MQSTVQSLSDEELALEAQAGSRPCFEELAARYVPKIFCFLRPKIGSDQDIEDIIQETLFKLYRNITRYDHKWKFSTWIYTAANRMAISHYRSTQKRDFTQLPAYTISDPQEKLLKAEQSQNLWIKAQNLKPEQYEALWLRYVEDMSSLEIAKIMQKTNVAIRILLHRARLNLAKEFRADPTFEKDLVPSGPEGKNLHYTENRG